MNNPKNLPRFAGFLFLLAVVVSIAGGSLLEPLLNAPDPLAALEAQRALVGWAVALEFINAIAVLLIAALLFFAFWQHAPALAITYLGFRIAEALLYLLGASVPLILLNATAGSSADPTFFLSMRNQMMLLLMPVFFSLGGFVLYFTTLRAGLLPRFLTLWGLVAVPMVFAANVWEWGAGVQVALVLPILLNEVVLSVWLMAKGFYQPAKISPSP